MVKREPPNAALGRRVNFSIESIDIRLIRIFMTVVEAGGMTAAQGELNLALSTVSEKISSLEKRFGVGLCRRGRSGFALTEAGEQFYQECEKLVSALDQFGQRTMALGSRMPRNFTLGLVDNMISHPDNNVSSAIADFADCAPGVHLKLVTLNPSELLSEVLARRVDMVVGSFPKMALGLDYIDLFDEQHNFYCAEGHPLFDVPDAAIDIETIRDHRIIARGYWGSRDTRIFAISAPHATVVDMEAEAHLILSARYLGYLPDHMAQTLSHMVRLRAIRPDLFSYNARFQIALRPNWERHPATKLMVESLRRRLA